MQPLKEYFPLPAIREKQDKAIDFIQRAIDAGYRDIVIAAPTGAGKAGLGSTVCNWAAQPNLDIPGEKGGYYLVTQKLLQNQMDGEASKYLSGLNRLVSIKTASEYRCPRYGNCAVGRSKGKKPHGICEPEECTYSRQKAAFCAADIAVTNYPYFFTERTYSKQLPSRKVLVCDECHTLEMQIIKFVDIVVAEALIPEYAPTLMDTDGFPKDIKNVETFIPWVAETYLPAVKEQRQITMLLAEDGGEKEQALASKLEQYVQKLELALEEYKKEGSWVFWRNEDKNEMLEYIVRPTNAAPFFKNLVADAASVRIYMSAYPGIKSVFCRSLGLAEDDVAWCSLSSSFPVENRKFVAAPLGSMSKRNVEDSLPSFFKVLKKIMDKHAGERGIIHCHSYVLGDRIAEFISQTEHAHRLIYPRKGEDRDEAFQQHSNFDEPSIIMSPSMTEGFDFADDLARWQVIAKVPYPSLGDAQVVAKMEEDQEWYNQQVASTILQAAGRVCRSDTDYGVTYCFDADLYQFWNKSKYLFPKWFQKSFIWKIKGAR